jgi:purine-binding chemotaxis protein CheW
LEKVHANLHYLVKTIVQLKKKGNELQAEQEYQKIGEVSDEIISLLNAIERQVSASQTASSRASNEQEKKRILHERAQILAQKPKRDANGGAAYLSVVLFSLADETYALELGHVREVYTLEDLTPLPCTPPFIIGIINVRGQIFSVVDLKKLFNLPDQERTDLSKAILIEAGGMAFGVLANLILGVQSISLKAIQPPPPTLTGFQAEYVKGITNEPVIILNALKILADERLVVYEEVAG